MEIELRSLFEDFYRFAEESRHGEDSRLPSDDLKLWPKNKVCKLKLPNLLDLNFSNLRSKVSSYYNYYYDY